MRPSTVDFLKDVYARIKGRKVPNDATTGYEVHLEHHGGIVIFGDAPAWHARPQNAEFQSRIIIREHTMNLPGVARQPHPDPDHAPHTALRPPV